MQARAGMSKIGLEFTDRDWEQLIFFVRKVEYKKQFELSHMPLLDNASRNQLAADEGLRISRAAKELHRALSSSNQSGIDWSTWLFLGYCKSGASAMEAAGEDKDAWRERMLKALEVVSEAGAETARWFRKSPSEAIRKAEASKIGTLRRCWLFSSSGQAAHLASELDLLGGGRPL